MLETYDVAVLFRSQFQPDSHRYVQPVASSNSNVTAAIISSAETVLVKFTTYECFAEDGKGMVNMAGRGKETRKGG
ncbi:hypothetical protein WG66_013101 [Moniliophthora roreri]|nr:hypothetical protein WG66_013101 [Moniliophthora roreri]